MPQFHFSEEFKAKMREQIMPYSFEVLKEATDSSDIYIEEVRCLSCGFVQTNNPPKLTKATAVHDCKWTHEFSWETGKRCGGQIAFATHPAFTLA